MKQVILEIHLGGWQIPIYGYGLMLVIGFLLAAHWAKYLARRCGLDGEVFVNLALLGLVTGIVGARASHILENLGDFTRGDRTAWENFLNMINLRSGGLTYYGGFLLAFPTVVGYALWKKLPLRTVMDIAAPCLMVALGFGRVGCFMNGCCFGAECNVPWAIRLPYDSPPYVDQYLKGEIKPDPRLVETINGIEPSSGVSADDISSLSGVAGGLCDKSDTVGVDVDSAKVVASGNRAFCRQITSGALKDSAVAVKKASDKANAGVAD
jgi:hypothetical protein